MIEFKFPDPLGGPSKQTEQVTPKMPSKFLPLTPPRLAGPILIVEEKNYPSCFDSDDEFESDDSSSIAESEILFRRRPTTPPKSASKGKTAPAKAVSLLTMQLKHCRNRYPGILLKDSQLLLGDDSDEGPSAVGQEIQDPETTSCSDAEWVSEQSDAESCSESDGIKHSHHEHSTAAEPIEHDHHVLTPIAEEPEPIEQQRIVTQPNICFNGLRKSSFLAAITKAIITNFKHYTSITWLPRKPLTQAIYDEQEAQPEEEEVDPYILFFGNNQDCGIPPKPKPTLKPIPKQQKGKGKQPASTTTTTTTTPRPVPLTPQQQQLARDQANLATPFQEGWANNQSQIAKAGPLNIKSIRGANKKRGDVSYIERDYDWVCCGCGAANSRYEFLCCRCRAHSKQGCCEEVVEELDGVAGWGAGRLW